MNTVHQKIGSAVYSFDDAFCQILKTLHRTYTNMKLKPVWTDINPKAVTTDELFGYLHPATREWKDGEEV